MKKINLRSGRQIFTIRRTMSLLAVLTMLFVGLSVYQPSEAANPASGSLAATVGTNINWTGDRTVGAAANGEPSCSTGDSTATNCDVFTLTIPAGNWSGKLVRVRFDWGTISGNDFDMVVRRESNGAPGMQGDGLTGVAPTLDSIVATSGNGAPNNFEEVVIAPPDSGETYYIRAIYFLVPDVLTDQYQGSAIVESNVITPPPTGTAALPNFDNYHPPVGYPKRDNSGEPSIGINWNTDNVMTMSRLQPNRTTFNDSTSPSDPNTTKWFARSIPTVVTGLDPIGFTDHITGRSFYGELNGNFTNGIISDDDLATTTPMPLLGFSPTSSVDHQTIGGGPPSPNGILQPNAGYPHMVYYAAQNIAVASVAASFNGGLTFNTAIPAYNLTQCGGLHGHIKVAPNDGTVYLPNKGCNGKSGFAVSTDNGTNWTVRTVPTSTAGNTDPSVGIGSGGRIYFAYAGSDNHPHVAVSDDRGVTWRNDFDLALSGDLAQPLTAAVFMHSVAGDNDRAAVFFLATDSTNPGDPVGDDTGGVFAGTWYPYIAVTYDGGNSWRVTRADNDPLNPGVKNPVQQGVVCTNGTTCPDGTRNLLDFNELAVDSRGRIVAVYADGCNFDDTCISVPDNAPLTAPVPATKENNQGIARLTLIRQRDGLRLFSVFDPGGPAAPSLSPPVQIEEKRRGNHIKWATPADGGSPLTSYRVYRGQAGSNEKLIAEVKAGVHTFQDNVRTNKLGSRSENYYYHVTAVNKYGESPRSAKVFPSVE